MSFRLPFAPKTWICPLNLRKKGLPCWADITSSALDAPSAQRQPPMRLHAGMQEQAAVSHTDTCGSRHCLLVLYLLMFLFYLSRHHLGALHGGEIQ